MIDFTLTTYQRLLDALESGGYVFQTVDAFIRKQAARAAILRHDIDKSGKQTLRFARIEHERNIRGTYYFRCPDGRFDEGIILSVAAMGHEIGYHYETLDTNKGYYTKAFREFCKNLERLRQLAPVTTICMHNDPVSMYDNKTLWYRHEYFDLGIIGEPYFDIDLAEVGYYTDSTGRWRTKNLSIREKQSKRSSDELRSTPDIIRNIRSLPDQVMFTFHPHRWKQSRVAGGLTTLKQMVAEPVAACRIERTYKDILDRIR